MAHSFTLSSIAGLAIAGAGLGLYLGKSAISEINPAYFSSPTSGSTFHADLVANRASLDAAPPAFAIASSPLDAGNECVGCSTYPEEYFPVQDPAMESYGSSYSTYRTAPAERVIAEADAYVAQGPSREELERLQRYAHYTVPREEAPAVAEAAPRQTNAQEPSEADDCTATDTCEAPPAPAA